MPLKIIHVIGHVTLFFGVLTHVWTLNFVFMSRLPRFASSPDRVLSAAAPVRKRKSEDECDDTENLRKIPALAHPTKPGSSYRPGRSISGTYGSGGTTRQPLITSTSANQPPLPSKLALSTSQPPKTHKPPSASARPHAAGRVKPPSSSKSTGPQRISVEEDRYKRLQEQMSDMEAARLADATRRKCFKC